MPRRPADPAALSACIGVLAPLSRAGAQETLAPRSEIAGEFVRVLRGSVASTGRLGQWLRRSRCVARRRGREPNKSRSANGDSVAGAPNKADRQGAMERATAMGWETAGLSTKYAWWNQAQQYQPRLNRVRRLDLDLDLNSDFDGGRPGFSDE